jgi:hypothetical protein
VTEPQLSDDERGYLLDMAFYGNAYTLVKDGEHTRIPAADVLLDPSLVFASDGDHDEEIRSAGAALSAVKRTAYVPYSHELLCDSGTHRCDDTCSPPYVPPPVPWQRRLRYFLRRRWWAVKRIPGYRLVHEDDIRRDDE